MEEPKFSEVNSENCLDPRFYDLANVMGMAVFFNSETGEIKQTQWSCLTNIIAEYQVTGIPFVGIDERISHKEKYIKDWAIADRPENPAVLAGKKITNLPIPCTIEIDDQMYECNESSVDLEFDAPGIYRVSVNSWPYMEKEFSVENPA